jgi:hypothetical protein
MAKRISEQIMFDSEALSISSAAGTTSKLYNMRDYAQAGVAVAIESTGFASVAVNLISATAATAAGSSGAAGTTGITAGMVGTTLASTEGGVRALTFTFGTAATAATTWNFGVGADVRTVNWSNDATYVGSTALATVVTTADLYYGTTAAGSTADTGIQLAIDAFKTAINSTLAWNGSFIFSTAATNTLKVTLTDEATGMIRFSGGAANVITAVAQEAQVAWEVDAANLSTAGQPEHIGVNVASAATACNVAVSVVRSGGRYMPGGFKGNYIST